MSPANLVQIGPRVFQITYAKIGAPPKMDEKSVVNRQSLSRTLIDLAQIWNID